MGQVPSFAASLSPPYVVVVGDGRLARSLIQLAPSFLPPSAQLAQIKRVDVPLRMAAELRVATHVWLAIPDPWIAPFAHENLSPHRDDVIQRKATLKVVHFAGALPSFDEHGVRLHAAHPLMTFTGKTLSVADRERFFRTPFALSPGSPPLQELLPGLSNPTFTVRDDDRTHYHALCALAGNFTVVLWEAVAGKLRDDLGLTADVLAPYREQIFANLAGARDGESVLTGPLSRGDNATALRHQADLLARAEPALARLYSAFVDVVRTEFGKTAPSNRRMYEVSP